LTTKIIHKRCSRPLCSSQATTGTPVPSPQRLPTHRCLRTTTWTVRLSGTSPQPPEPHPHPQAKTRLVATLNEQPSGCSLRTQQRAQPTPPQQPTVPTQNPEGPGVLGRHQLESRP
jgi:hypothetical protein